MTKLKLLITVALAVAFLFAQVGNVAAAPAQTATPITGTITAITTETDANGVTTVVVELVDDQGATQTVRLSLETAENIYHLITVDPVTNVITIDESKLNQPISIDPATVIPDTTTETVNPISSLLGAFFDMDASVIDGFHNDGFGFGVIAQALWMSKNLNGEITLDQILQAKKDGSGEFTLADGTVITYTNWGQFKKALLDHKNNLGSIVSGHADPDQTFQHGNGNGHGQGNGNGNGHGNNNGNGHSNGNNKP